MAYQERGINNRWVKEPTKLAKTLLCDGINNTDLKKSRNDDDESTDSCSTDEGQNRVPVQVGPGLFPTHKDDATYIESEFDYDEDDEVPSEQSGVPGFAPVETRPQEVAEPERCDGPEQLDSWFSAEETLFIFDWDDTVLPSSWVQGQGLRLDDSSEVLPWHRQQLSKVAAAAAETLRLAKQLGTVVLITNAERGWIELSCQKFLPTLFPALESVKVLSARTTYESSCVASPLDWKVNAFAAEVARIYGNGDRRKNVLSLGDSVHEREALLRSTSRMPNCRSKSLKFVERPDISQICKQHALVCNCFEKIVARWLLAKE
ncbi:unnamed protein product [Durusdinium trenchii]|uniref:Uncharacterized protein n=1 Tax=Durusdinium trenchii TaxID=1381693 RepID=A0ABP0PYI8_9DINO